MLPRVSVGVLDSQKRIVEGTTYLQSYALPLTVLLAYVMEFTLD